MWELRALQLSKVYYIIGVVKTIYFNRKYYEKKTFSS